MATRIIRTGKQGWLEKNYEDLKRLEVQSQGYVQVYKHKVDSFDVIILGKGRYKRFKLHLRCTWSKPSIPPNFNLVNKAELTSTGHPHLTTIHGCLKVPWTPNTSLTSIVEAIKEVWWHPKD